MSLDINASRWNVHGRDLAPLATDNRSNQMAGRTRKAPAFLVKRNATAAVSYVRELPGAVFYGELTDADIEFAAGLQRIRREYENDDCQEMLWHDLSQMGFSTKEIREFVVNPAAITNCGYGMPNGLTAVVTFG
jgi:hypothetical protein